MAKKNTGDKEQAPGTVIPEGETVTEAAPAAKAETPTGAQMAKKLGLEVGTPVLYVEMMDRADSKITCEAKIIELDVSGQLPVAKLEVNHPYGHRLVNGVIYGGPDQMQTFYLADENS